jgi:hypothetical protein
MTIQYHIDIHMVNATTVFAQCKRADAEYRFVRSLLNLDISDEAQDRKN